MPDNATLGFGRSTNDGGELSSWEWGEFRHELHDLVAGCGGVVHFTGEGLGHWQGSEERAGCIAFFADQHTDWTWLRYSLVLLARKYRQDAIALTVAESELIGCLRIVPV